MLQLKTVLYVTISERFGDECKQQRIFVQLIKKQPEQTKCEQKIAECNFDMVCCSSLVETVA